MKLKLDLYLTYTLHLNKVQMDKSLKHKNTKTQKYWKKTHDSIFYHLKGKKYLGVRHKTQRHGEKKGKMDKFNNIKTKPFCIAKDDKSQR